MSFDLSTIADDLGDRLREVLPGFDVRNADLAAGTYTLDMLLTYEQLDISAEFDGSRLPTGWVGVDFQLTLAAPETDPEAGTARLSAALPAVCRALDGLDDLVWNRAIKARDNAGTFYNMPISLLAQYPEPDEEPDPQEG